MWNQMHKEPVPSYGFLMSRNGKNIYRNEKEESVCAS